MISREVLVMKCLVGGKVILKDRVAEGLNIYFDDKIRAITTEMPDDTCEVIDCKGLYISAGFIDIHIHGYANIDVADADYEGIKKVSKRLPENGVTSWVPTSITAPMDDVVKVLEVIRKMIPESKTWEGSEILGVNVEGPFLNVKKKGAHEESLIIPPSAEAVADYADVIKLITVAPEMDEGFKNIKRMKELGIRVALGHSDANYDTAIAAFTDGGINHITHLFNAQTSLLHRDPGIVGAALVSDVYTELICDTYHVSKNLFPLVHKMKGDKLCIITDCVRAGGMPDGRYMLGNLAFNLSGIKCTLDDGTIAGSVLKMNYGVKNFYENSGCTLWEAVNAATINPATAVSVNKTKGSIEISKDADFAVFDNNFDIKLTISGGKTCYEA
jgi:N-acetylglucosamine-6-phosphate deacetylase